MTDDDEYDSSDGSNAPSLKISSSSPTTTAALSTGPAVTPIFNSLNDFADEEDENNDSSAHPLLSSIKKKVKIGSFSIRYNPRQKQHGQYYSPAKGSSSSSSQFHDFTPHETTDDHELDDDDDLISNPQHYYNHRGSSSIYSSAALVIIRFLHKLQHFSNQYFLPLRILLLSLYLAFTLSSFWILDSIKEPTLAILVDGNLGKHQPRAKMVSFVVVIALAVGMEWLDRLRRLNQQNNNDRGGKNTKRRRGDSRVDRLNEELKQSWSERNLPLSMRMSSSMDSSERDNFVRTKWRSMKVRSSQFWNHFAWRDTSSSSTSEDDNDDDNGESSTSSSKITTMAFYIVGSFYIHGFVTVAIALKTHPSFRSSVIFHNVNQVAELESVGGLDVYQSSEFSSAPINVDDGDGHGDWYYPTLGYILFALVESFGSVSITIFWAFANSHLTLESAERYYGSTVAVAQLGAIAGSTLSAVWGRRRQQQDDDQQQLHLILDEEGRVNVDMSVDTREGDAHVTPMLIFAACGCIGVGMVIMAVYAQLFSKPMRNNLQPAQDADRLNTRQIIGGDDQYLTETQPQNQNGPSDNNVSDDLFGGLRMIFRYEYLKLVLAASVLYEIALTCMHYELNLIGLDRFGVGISIVDEPEHSTNPQKSGSDEGITYIQFMGWYGQTVNILSLFLSFYAFPRLIKNYGLSTTIRIFPTVLLLVTIFAFVMFPRNLYFLFISLSICKALTYSVHDPSEEVLYMPTSDAVKFKAKFWIDVVGQRIAKAIGSAINNYAGSVEGIVKYGSLPSILTALILWLACYQVGVLFDGLIKSGNVVGIEEEQCSMLEISEQVGDDDDSDESDLFREPHEDVVTTKFGKANRTLSGSEHVFL